MSKLKVMTVVGTRPEIIRLARVITALNETTEHRLLHTGQNYDYELNEIFFRDLELRAPDLFLNAAAESAAKTIGNIIAKTDGVLEAEKPDALLVLGDTNSCMAALAAKRRKIPVFHMEAGNRCFDERVPEEINRRVIDHIADINMPYSSIAREYLLREGIPPDRVVKTGSPMFEVLTYFRSKIEASGILTELDLKPDQFFVVSCHREENVDNPQKLSQLVETLNRLADAHGKTIIFSVHPRTRKRLDAAGMELSSLILQLKPLGFLDYNKLQLCARAVLSDSGTISEEASILGLNALNIREAHERPEGMEETTAIMTGLSPSRILGALDVVARPKSGAAPALRPVNDYFVPNVAEKVVRIIYSYTDFVRRKVWQDSV